MCELTKQNGLEKVIEVPFEVNIDKNLTSIHLDKNDSKSQGLLHGRRFKGSFKYDPSNLEDMGLEALDMSILSGQESGLISVNFEFINLDTGLGKKIFTEKDDQKYGKHSELSIWLLNKKAIGFFFLVGDIHVRLSPYDIAPRPESCNKAGFAFYSSPYELTEEGTLPKYFTFFVKNGSLSGHGNVKFNI